MGKQAGTEDGVRAAEQLLRSRLREMVDTALDVAHAKGWEAELDSIDEDKQRFASVYVSKNFGGTTHEVSAMLEFTCDEKIALRIEKSSFHSNGLSDLRDAIWRQVERFSWVSKKQPAASKENPIGESIIAERILRRFNRSVRQLKHRHADRDPIVIVDEYDVQDYLHALLRAFFDDVRAEEYCPSYAGGSSRIDFLLKKESIAIEVKMASKNLRDRHVGEQLIIDIERYKSHPGCKTLLCLVYDPEGFIQNPSGIEVDLTKESGELNVRVVVVSPA